MSTIEQVVDADIAQTLKRIVDFRIGQALAPRFKHPLGFPTWTSEEVLAAIDCLCEQKTTMWHKCEAFENEFATYLGSENAVMVNSGSSADLVMMLAAKELGMLKPGDEILMPAVTWPTQAWAAIQAGFKVKFVDVELSTLNTSAGILAEAITPKTKAIFLVHLMGNPCEMDTIQELCDEKGLLLFEDCCEALGASFDGRKVGSWGQAAAFSFFASHHISTMEGGMVATSNPEFAETCRLVRAHGWARDLKHRLLDVDVLTRYGSVDDPRYLFLAMGFNFRPTELQGAIGSVQLRKLDSLNSYRNQNAERVHGQFRVTNGHTVAPLIANYKAEPAWFALPFVLKEGLPYTRKEFTAYLERYGIDTRPIVGGNLLRHPAFWKFSSEHLPGADAIHERGFYVGLPPYEDSLSTLIGILNGADSVLRFQCAS